MTETAPSDSEPADVKKGIVLRIVTLDGDPPSEQDRTDIEGALENAQMDPTCTGLRVEDLTHTPEGTSITAYDDHAASLVTNIIHNLKNKDGVQRFEVVHSHELLNCIRYFVSVERRLAQTAQQFCQRLRGANPKSLNVSKMHIRTCWETAGADNKPRTNFVVWVEAEVDKYLRRNNYQLYFGVGKIKFVLTKRPQQPQKRTNN